MMTQLVCMILRSVESNGSLYGVCWKTFLWTVKLKTSYFMMIYELFTLTLISLTLKKETSMNFKAALQINGNGILASQVKSHMGPYVHHFYEGFFYTYQH